MATRSTHYRTLGVESTATGPEIRTAYRRLVLKHHPDRTHDPRSTALFVQIQEAYEVLGNPQKRRDYDRSLESRPSGAPYSKPAAPPTESPAPGREETSRAHRIGEAERRLREDVEHLAYLFGRGKLGEAGDVAREVLRRDPRQAMPYAVLGDIARGRGDLNEASKMYAFAIQMAPGNPAYERRYDEVLRKQTSLQNKPADRPRGAMIVVMSWALVLCCLSYVALGRERPMAPRLELIGTWTLGLFMMLFVSGAILGAGASLAGYLDRFQSTTTNALGGVSPAFYLGIMAMVNYWAAAGLYILTSLVNGSSSLSVSRVVASVGGITFFATVASGLSGHIEPTQTLLWGGNVAYIGTIVGWMIADSLADPLR
ncbi:MAG: J domain-containing protein [Fimbriimonadaceae bacterium]|nr:J domain-containing protein [Fimbriimonadaceae bacterium]